MPNYRDLDSAMDRVSDLIDDLSGGNSSRYDLTAIALHTVNLEEDSSYSSPDDFGPYLEAMLYYPCTEYRAEITCDAGRKTGHIDVYGWNNDYVEKLTFAVPAVELITSVQECLSEAGYQVDGRHPHGGLKLRLA